MAIFVMNTPTKNDSRQWKAPGRLLSVSRTRGKMKQKAEAAETDQKQNVIETAAGTTNAESRKQKKIETAAHNLGEDAKKRQRKDEAQ